MSARLDLDYRRRALRTLADTELDVLIIGGGVVGAGAALDAASRGLSVGLVEARDWAAGTSSRSSKLVHGGLRYLEQRDFGLVREALHERGLLLNRLAPHLVRPVPFLYPLRHRGWERAYVGAGVFLYDTLGGARTMPRHRHLSRRRALRVAPALRPDRLTGAIGYYDAQVDDARYALTLVRTAAQHGAAVVNRAAATGLVRNGGRVVGATVRDSESGAELTIRARRVIGAAGVWTDELLRMAGVRGPFQVRASKGAHLLVPRSRIPMATGVITRTERSVLLIIPWGQHWLIGTTDTPWDCDPDEPTASQADVDYLLGHANQVLSDPLTTNDVVGVYAGLRPLLAGDSADTARLSREHAIAEPAPGLFVIAGGKYTTYRVMAADVVNAATRDLGREVAPSLTAHLPLVGAVGYHEMWDGRHELAHGCGLDVPVVEHLLGRYGAAVTELLAMVVDEPDLAAPVSGAEPYLRVEARYAATHEGALHVADVLARRTRASIETSDGGASAAREIAEVIAPVLGWDEATIRAELTPPSHDHEHLSAYLPS